VAEFQDLVAADSYAATTEDLAKILDRPPRKFVEFARDFSNAFSLT
jgi:hypothetical protein